MDAMELDRERVQAKQPEWGCFLCAYSDITCDMSFVEGRLLGARLGGERGRIPWVLLLAGDGVETAIALPTHTAKTVGALATLPPERLHELTARVYHVLRDGPDSTDASPTRLRLRTTPASALVVEPNVLLNITDINNAEYCVRQYPLRRMVPSPPTSAALRGTIIHSAFKELLKGGNESGHHYLERALHAATTDLALSQLSYADMAMDAEPHMAALTSWYDAERQSLWGDAPHVRAETFLLAPEVGLKGRLDFLLEDGRGGVLLELKTGEITGDTQRLPRRQHRWQVHGYQTLLAARRPDAAERHGATLLYSGTPGMAEGHGVPFVLRDLHHVLDLRNALALVHATGIVPPPPGGQTCGRCALRGDCFRASALLSWEAPPTDEQLDLPDGDDAAWFRSMYELLRLEARVAEAESTVLWNLPARERTRLGIALGGLEQAGEPRRTESGEWEYTLACANTSELREGDAVLLSDGDPVRGAVVSGTILRLDERGVTVWVPERIANPSLLDRYDSDIVHTRTIRNLWRWLEADVRMKELIAGRRVPAFDQLPPLDDLPPTFNSEQREAVRKALAARDFAVVQGPPGTGKTKVVAEIAARAMARGERVLVAAFTNQAVDNVLRRLLELGSTELVRLGHELSVAPELRSFRLAERAEGSDPVALRDALLEARLVAATTATWSAERFDVAGEPLRFDLAIVDEASQLTVPAVLGALRFARRFVLVGDEKQLPPLVVSEVAAEQGLKRSLFTSLIEHWGETASVALRYQYRMHPTICSFPSAAFYAGRLEAAGVAATATLPIPALPTHPLWPMLAPERPLVFVNVSESDNTPAGKISVMQAEVVRRLVRALLESGVAPTSMGVIAPYRAQVAAIRQRLETLTGADRETCVVVDTVDRFQGAEREVVLFSFGGRVGAEMSVRGVDFLADPHRLNVALSRAQRKLILIGDREWLARTPLLAQLMTHCEQLYGGRGGVVDVAIGSGSTRPQRARRG